MFACEFSSSEAVHNPLVHCRKSICAFGHLGGFVRHDELAFQQLSLGNALADAAGSDIEMQEVTETDNQ